MSDSPTRTRCSPIFFCNIMDKMRGLMRPEHEKSISTCPFSFFMNMPRAYGTYTRLGSILSRFDVDTCEFSFGEDITVPFTSSEFCIVTGLQHHGLHVDPLIKLPSNTLDRHFEGEPSQCTRKNIVVKLKELVKSTAITDVDDFCRMYILLVFSTLLFPTSTYTLARGLVCYVDDLLGIRDFSWGVVVYQFLLGGIQGHLQKNNIYVNGFTTGLMAWFYEHFPTYGSARSLRAYPRFFRWQAEGHVIPKDEQKANEKLNAITRTQFVEITTTQTKEQQLFAPQVTSQELGNLHSLLRDLIRTLESIKPRQIIDDQEDTDDGDDVGDQEGKDDDGGGEEDQESEEDDEASDENQVDEHSDGSYSGFFDVNVVHERVDGETEMKREVFVENKGKETEIEGDENMSKGSNVEKEVAEDFDDHVKQKIVEKIEIESESEDDEETRMKKVNDTIINIAKSIQQREGRIKKQKDHEFTTSPSITIDKKKQKQKHKAPCKEVVYLGKTIHDQCAPFVGKLNYPGKEKLTEDEQKKIDLFIKEQERDPKDIIFSGIESQVFNVDVYRHYF